MTSNDICNPPVQIKGVDDHFQIPGYNHRQKFAIVSFDQDTCFVHAVCKNARINAHDIVLELRRQNSLFEAVDMYVVETNAFILNPKPYLDELL